MNKLFKLIPVLALIVAFGLSANSASACGGPCPAQHPNIPSSGGDEVNIDIDGGDVSYSFNLELNANGGTAIADASGGDNNSGVSQGGDAYGGDAYGGDGYGGNGGDANQVNTAIGLGLGGDGGDAFNGSFDVSCGCWK